MKFKILATSIVATLSVSAFAVKEHSHSRHKEPIWTTDAQVFHSGLGYCGTPGKPCHTVKRAADAVAEALANAEAKKNNALSKGGIIYFCGAPGSSCNEKRHFVKKIGAAAEKAHHSVWAREAEAEAETLAEADPKKKKKKHGDAVAPGGIIYFCGAPGSSCNEKRDAEAEAVAEADPKKKKKKHGDAVAPGGIIYFCGAPGSSCNEKRAAYEREASAEAVRALNKLNPALLRDECFKEGNECDTILKAHKAFHHAKREAEALFVSAADPETGLAYCSGSGCSQLAKAHLGAAKDNHPHAKQAEHECHGPHGSCKYATRAIDELEETINEAMASLQEV